MHGSSVAEGPIRIGIPFTQQDIIDHLGVARQSVQREMKSLREQGCIDRRDGLWEITDPARLQNIACETD